MSIHIAEVVGFDEHVEETVFLKIGKTEFKAFDPYGNLYPLHIGHKYNVVLELFLDEDSPIEICGSDIQGLQQIDGSFRHNLYGKMKNGKFNVGDFVCEDEYLKSFPNLEGKFIKITALRIGVEFISECK